MKQLDLATLTLVTGGAQTQTPMPNMGAPKYSAAWWDLVRARGLGK